MSEVEAPLIWESDDQNDTVNDDSCKPTSTIWKLDEIWKEMKKQGKLGGPLVWYNLMVFSIQIISVMFVGHLGELPLSAASIATSFAAVTGFILQRGMASALDTFCGQSYGAEEYHMVGIHTQRAMLVLLLTSIPVAFIWANAGYILAFVGQDPQISMEAGNYARYMIPSVFAYGLLQCQTIFLQAQNNVIPMIPIAGFTTLVHLLVCWVLVFKSGLGNKGAAIANSVSYWLNVVLLGCYVEFFAACQQTWTGFSKDAFALDGVFKFLKLAIPSAVMLCLEVWSFEMMVLLAGFLPNPKLETSVLSISVDNNLQPQHLFNHIPLGLSGAVSTRVSNELDAGRAYVARLAVGVSLLMVIMEGVSAAFVLVLGHNYWGYFYTNNQQIINYVGQMLILISLSHFVDGIQSVLSGTARGCGWQKVGAFVNLAAYYLAGIPCSLLLAFVYRLGGRGLWTGIIVALSIQASILLIVTICTDWETEAKKAKDRVVSNMKVHEPRA